MAITDTERAAMHRALALAETVRGRTSPNPAVGAVILGPDGTLAGEGATAPPGGPHAEIAALRHAGDAARGGTAVVTLEPCAHTGRTGPCADALVAAGIARVVYAVDDPNPVAAGGAQVLDEAGVDVVRGVEAHAAASGALRPWLHAVRTGRPFVTWKFAASLDGRVAAADYTARWISSPASRADVHGLRAAVDAILVGSGTVLADDPHLTVRDGDRLADHQPLRVVLDRRHRIPPDARVLDAAAETLVLDTAVPQFGLKALYDRGVRHLLLEGGPTLAGSFLREALVDKLLLYVAPTLAGQGRLLVESLPEPVPLTRLRAEPIGEDVLLTAYVHEP